MSSTSPRSRQVPGHEAEKGAEAAVIAANEFLLRHYSTSLMGGSPRRLSTEGHLWAVPIILTSPGYGAVGEVGSVTVDARAGRIAESTPKDEVTAAMQRLAEEKHGALEAAFLRARTA